MVYASNDTGFAAIAETVLGDYPGVNGSGRLVSIEFLIVGYGCTELNVSVEGYLPTTLLNSTGGNITFTTTGGYFRNKLQGDANGDGIVDVFDKLKVISLFGMTPEDPEYDRNVDINDDGIIDVFDKLLVVSNFGRSL
jgi:hypothetical protein